VVPIHPLKRPRTLTEQAADAIRARIVSGDFQLGEALSEITLAAELGVSKTPVREAFLQLKNEGLVEIQPQRGTFVFQMTSHQIRQLTAFRELLEVEALRLGMTLDRAHVAEVLGEIVKRMSDAVAAGDSRLYRQIDNDFHMQIILACRNEFIETAYSSIAFRVQALRNRLSLQPDQNHRSLAEHRKLAVLAEEGDIEVAGKMLLDHVRATLREYVSIVEKMSPHSSPV
jgi:DNA-binding GntR family transcriptional regulator